MQAGVPPTQPSKPLSQIMVPGTKIPVDAAIGYASALVTEVINANIVPDKYQPLVHVVAAVLAAIGHALQIDGL
jgi:hypothetical protein